MPSQCAKDDQLRTGHQYWKLPSKRHLPLLHHPSISLSSFVHRHILLMTSRRFLLVRRPIKRKASKSSKGEEEAIYWQMNGQLNQLYMHAYREDDISDGLLDAMAGSPKWSAAEVNE
ncbi:hypothetical protein niasHT_005518 [Heterodera trifolii]|uniref:Uncharacterized protein n=1 Tax=Heterodera trifolii TaxID=157864 RepID=A0ABD2LUN8_9BILA